jgi:putative ABC transport system ATP-binding protein
MLIDASDLKKSYKDRQGQIVAVLKGLTLQVDAGAFVAVVGPSGSGKSTLLNILGCLEYPDDGRYLFDGQDTGAWPERRRAQLRNQRIGFVFQKFHLLPFLNVQENVELPFLYRNSDHQLRGRTAGELLESVGLPGKERRYPGELSAGEQQRVAVARALILGADVILADEPTGNLDPDNAKGVLDLFEQLVQQGKTVVVVTHDPLIAPRAQRELRLEAGQFRSPALSDRRQL